MGTSEKWPSFDSLISEQRTQRSSTGVLSVRLLVYVTSLTPYPALGYRLLTVFTMKSVARWRLFMRVVLQPMTEETFQIYLREHEDEYARDRMITDQESFEEALRVTQSQHEALLPQGLQTPGHYFFVVLDENQNKHVGYVWFACRPSSPQLSLYHILIKKADRRKGFGRSVLSMIEQRARQNGCQVVWLNVMGHNQGAIDFYHACGYRVAAMHLNKFLNPT
jgi:ribosomal protein S18 acetylase RimI-like enzyme